MKNIFFESMEECQKGEGFTLLEALDNLQYNADGLVPVITQDASSMKILMMAWMNRESIEKSLATKCMTYWSRSRQSFWIKGETSGNTQLLKQMSIDCDGDSILCLVEQKGGACHTGRPNCFYWDVNSVENKVVMS
ncbi:MAG: phosphoribosyl-AMP cyclohydrolase [Arenicella sp.]